MIFSDHREAREPASVEPEVDCGLRSAPASRLARIAQKFLLRIAAIIPLTASRVLALLDVLHEYTCGALRRVTSQR